MNLSNRMVIVWNRGKAKINRLLHIAPPRTCTVHDTTCRFPPELTEMIIVHLIGDLHALKTFSLICRDPTPYPYTQEHDTRQNPQ